MRAGWANLVFLGVFGAAITGAWAWFNVAPSADQEGLRWLVAKTDLPEFNFVPERLGESALELLGEPDYVAGAFNPSPGSGSRGDRITVFFANWSAHSRQGITVIQHTPDVCWVGSGWQPRDAGQPNQVELRFPVTGSAKNDMMTLVFECRTFLAPAGGAQELVLWCTLVSGRLLPESTRFRLSKAVAANASLESNEEKQLAVGRRLSADYFLQAVRQRLRARGTKQFVRFSTPLRGDCQLAIEGLTNLIQRCLTVQVRENG